MQRRVEQPHGDGEPVHGRQDLDEVGPLRDAQFFERRGFLLGGVGQDHAAHDGQPVLAQEHVLGPAEPDPLGPEPASVGRVGPRVGIGADAEMALPDLVRPAEQGPELRRRLGRHQGHRAQNDGARTAVERQPLPLGDGHRPDAQRVGADPQHLGPDDGRLPPAARDDGRVAHEAAPGGEDPLGRQHPVDVLG